MSRLNQKQIFKFPIKKTDQKRVIEIIKLIGTVSTQGGGKVPLDDILILAGWHGKSAGSRIKKQRGDLFLKSRKGTLEGKFINTGKRLRETVPDIPMFKPDIVAEKNVGGFFKVYKNQLNLAGIRGLTVIQTLGDNLFDLTFRVESVVLTPQSVAVF